MSKKRYTTISISESNQVFNELYQFIQGIKIPDLNIEKWYLEYLPDSNTPAICLKRISNAKKVEENILGGYTAQISFLIRYQAPADDTDDLLKITQPFDAIGQFFDEETEKNFPNLELSNAIPRELTMTATAEDDNGLKDGKAISSAQYEFIYYKKGKFE